MQAELARPYSARIVLALALVFAFSLGKGGVWAQGRLESEIGISAEVQCAWPEDMSVGYFPILVSLESDSDEPRTITVRAETNQDRGNEIETRIELQPGEGIDLELLAPAFGVSTWWMGTQTYSVVIESGGERASFGGIGSFGVHHSGSNVVRPVLRFAPDFTPGFSGESWEEELTQRTWEQMGNDYRDISLAPVRFGEAARSHRAYSSVAAVLVSTDEARPPRTMLEPLARWTRLGGILVFDGAGAEIVAREESGLAPWMEPRFLLEENGTTRVWSAGLGLLLVDDSTSFPSRDLVATLQRRLDDHPVAVPFWSGPHWMPEIPGFGDLPWRSLTLGLVLFAALIGPVNFVFLKRRKQPALLLVSIPVLAFLATILFIGYGLSYQGLDVKSAEFSWTMLDQREHRLAGVAKRTFYAGLSPAAGLAPEEGTSVFPLNGSRRAFGNNAPFHIQTAGQAGGGELLSADYLPVRRLARQIVTTERAARGRLAVLREGNELVVENGLGADIELMVLVDAQGKRHFTSDPVGAGARTTLASDLELWLRNFELTGEEESSAPAEVEVAVPANPLMGLYAELRRGRRQANFGEGEPLDRERQKLLLDSVRHELPPGTYAALMRTDPFRDDMGVESTELAGRHWIVGVLDLEEVR